MRLIDADALIEATNTISQDSTCPTHIAATYYQYMTEAPTVEVEPVRHGRWECVPSNGIGGTAKCSICGKAIYGYHTMNYCPNCGAKMTEGDASETVLRFVPQSYMEE